MKSSFRYNGRPIKSDGPLTYEESLRFDLQLAKWELDNAYAGFDYVTDPDLIDCYIFKLNAALKRYKYLLGKYDSLRKETLQADLSTVPCVSDAEPMFQPLAGV